MLDERMTLTPGIGAISAKISINEFIDSQQALFSYLVFHLLSSEPFKDILYIKNLTWMLPSEQDSTLQPTIENFFSFTSHRKIDTSLRWEAT